MRTACRRRSDIEIDHPCIPKRLTQTGLLLPANLPFEKWQSVLETLRGMEFSVMWWLGDCLRYGERAYGEKYAQALDATDYAYQTIADAKWVAGRFEISRRRENLTCGLTPVSWRDEGLGSGCLALRHVILRFVAFFWFGPGGAILPSRPAH